MTFKSWEFYNAHAGYAIESLIPLEGNSCADKLASFGIAYHKL